jgi:hypothetical protein
MSDDQNEKEPDPQLDDEDLDSASGGFRPGFPCVPPRFPTKPGYPPPIHILPIDRLSIDE